MLDCQFIPGIDEVMPVQKAPLPWGLPIVINICCASFFIIGLYFDVVAILFNVIFINYTFGFSF